MALFSIRHRRALAEKGLVVDIDDVTRVRLWRVLQRFNESYYFQPDPNDNWSHETDHLTEVPSRLLDAYGEDALCTQPSSRPSSPLPLDRWFRATEGERVLDAIEAFLSELGDDTRTGCAAAINVVLGEQDASWRLLDERFVLLDSVFVHAQIVQRARDTLGYAKVEGAVRELLDAQHNLTDGETRGAIHNAGSAFESVMKALLEREDGTASPLLKALVDDGFFDDLPEADRRAFVANVLMALPWMRNRFGGHGRGREIADPPDAYARLAVGLAAVFSEFLVQLHLVRIGDEGPGEPADLVTNFTAEPGRGAADFDPIGSADDDIPF